MLSLLPAGVSVLRDILRLMDYVLLLHVNLDQNGIITPKNAFLYVVIIRYGMVEVVSVLQVLMNSMEYA